MCFIIRLLLKNIFNYEKTEALEISKWFSSSALSNLKKNKNKRLGLGSSLGVYNFYLFFFFILLTFAWEHFQLENEWNLRVF